MTPTMLKILINIILFVLIGIFSGIFLYKLKIEQKGFKSLFIFYTIFWMPLMLLRPYANPMDSAIGSEINMLALVLSVYGIIGIFIRPFADYMNFKFTQRKAFLLLAIVSQFILYIPILVSPNDATNVLQSIGVGIGASCIGSFQLLFKEQYSPNKNYLNVSLLSIPPLLANFLTSPIQSLISQSSTNETGSRDPNILKYLWLIGIVLVIIAFVFWFFIKENKNNFFGFIKTEDYFDTKKETRNFLFIALIGMIITFIKFANSGGVATNNLITLGQITGLDVSSYEGYISIVFSIGQLIGGILVGTYLIKKMSTIKIFSIGIVVWIIYSISVIFILDPISYISIHALNGFAYGILYNLILAKTLSMIFNNTKKITPMGIYQGCLAIGIAVSGFFIGWIKGFVVENSEQFFNNSLIINSTIIGLSIFLWLIYFYNDYLNKKTGSDSSKKEPFYSENRSENYRKI